MEKRGIVDPQVTPAVDTPVKTAETQPTTQAAKIRQLDAADLQKQLAEVVADTLKSP
jgi:hypothetical protein